MHTDNTNNIKIQEVCIRTQAKTVTTQLVKLS